MERSVDRILTTHVGSLARPVDLLDLMKAKVNGAPYAEEDYARRISAAVAEVVSKQVESGIDIVTDGEQSKLGFSAYVSERLAGYEARPGAIDSAEFSQEVAAFPEYYERYFGKAMHGGAVAKINPVVCIGPVSYKGIDALNKDIENLKAAVAGVDKVDVFMPAVAPGGVGGNEYYPTEEEYLQAVGEAMRTEYKAIVDAGFIVQIDDPWMTVVRGDGSLSLADRLRKIELSVEVLNHSLRGIPPEQVRLHTCYGINEGPRIHDAALKDIVGVMLKVNAGAYSFEAANPRHEHEYHVWEDVKLPEGKLIIPGMVAHASNIVEHPELICERIVRFANIVGRENVIAGTDCGFSTQATYTPEVHPTVVWAKFQAIAAGARLATKQLWG
ncbi:MAG: cobalamin-independent methionine synthase II family protein [Gemmatimonadetes bacterium]|nr:cobalamin-independent methionine synthase II family protein [Gemmatimonadota bacterium]